MLLPGYHVEAELYRGRKRVVWRVRRESDDARVIVKSLADDFPSPADTAGLRREYEILRGLTLPGVARALDLVSHRDRVALVLEDAGERTLKAELAQGRLDLPRCLDIAIQVLRTLGELHRQGLLHKDLNPSNIILDRQGTARITDFSISSRVTRERPQQLVHPGLLEGTIAYMPPEQTGRVNRDLDHRSDLYAFGVTCYEMLTGELPFASGDALEVIHAHVALKPVPARQRNPDVPRPLSDLVMRLLAKNAEDRYQSAEGVLADLLRCQQALARDGAVPAFPLGQDDVRDRFVLPQRLYGREREVAALLAAFDRVVEEGSGLVLVSGYSGIGKTSLVHELHRPLTQRRGQFVAGKFDQLARDTPYAALAQAFRGLLLHLLAGSDTEVAEWRERILAAIGGNGQVLVDVIPTLERLIGPQPPVATLNPTEAQNRFQRAFEQLLGALTRADQPLVLFLDDLQWADSATLSLLPRFLANPEIRGLLLIGAYRDNEVSAAHPLVSALQAIRGQGSPVTEVVLPPLGPVDLQALLQDMLGLAPDTAQALAAVLQEKTGGNPFFAIQFLTALYQDGQLAFDRAARAWRVDVPAIGARTVTDNVVAFLTGRIQGLDESCRRSLRLAACIGSRFDLGTLATVAEALPEAVVAALWPALGQGLVLSEEQSYGMAPDLSDGRQARQRRFRFLHDRVQQASYALIPTAERATVHLAVGRLLYAGGEDPSRPEWLFEVVRHFNEGAELITDPAERLRVANLNLAAGRRAKSSAAFSNAYGCFRAGGALLGPEHWADHHALAFALERERAEAEYLTGRLADAERSYAVLLERAATPLERGEAYILVMNQYETTARYPDAIRAGLEGLRLLGHPLPEDPDAQRAELDTAMATIQAHLGGRPVASLLELPRLADPTVHAAIRLLTILWTPAFISGDSTLSDLVGARMVTLSLAYGNCEESAYGYVAFAMTVGWRLGAYALGQDYGLLGLALNDRLADLRLRGRVHHRFAALVNPWRRPFATCVPHAQTAVQAGLESGDFIIAAYGQFQQSWWGMHIAPTLDQFLEQHRPTVDFLTRMHATAYAEVQKMILHWGLALQGRTTAPTSLTGPEFDEAKFLASYSRKGIFGSWYVTLKLELLETFGTAAEARAAAREWEPTVELFTSSIWPAIFAFRHALALCAWLPEASAEERPEAEAKLDLLARRLDLWARNAPENFGLWARLADAEIARVRGDASAALGNYDAALALAQSQPSPRYRALVNEKFGQFWLERGQPEVAAAFLREAHFGYRQWGALGKVAALERRHADLFARTRSEPIARLGSRSTTTAQSSLLDLQSVIKVAQALAGEIDLERLLGRLMRLAIEHAGAERGTFLLEQDGSPRVRVTGTPATVTIERDGIPLAEAADLPRAVVNLVRRTGEILVHDDPAVAGLFAEDGYIQRVRPRSVLAAPVLNQGRLVGTLYLENNLASGVFTAERAQVLQIIAAQAAVALENARLFGEIRALKDRLQAENVLLAEEVRTQSGFEEIIGKAPALQKVLARMEQVASAESTVLITGETGTGKELVARAVHQRSARRERPLVTINCGAISPGLVESELFGHEKGAFTGAVARKLGRFELADGGTIFLDEIGDLATDLQVKLLRVLQEGEIERVGGTRTLPVNVRVIAATHRNLRELVDEGRFRSDLYYRVNIFPIHVPALRERREDIPLLARYFVLKHARKLGRQIETIPAEALDALVAYDWPGNVRELGNVIERSVLVSRGRQLELGDWIPVPRVSNGDGGGARQLQEVERAHILAVLEQHGWKVSGARGAAAALGLKPTTLEARMKRLGIHRPG
jgi:predicted ATPase